MFLAVNGAVATRGIYTVDTATGVPTLLKDLSAVDLGAENVSPNSLAWDPVKKHAYFKSFGRTGGDILYRWDATLNTVTPLLTIPGSANGSWYNRSYWFVTNGTGTLNRIDFKPNGSVDEVKSFANFPNSRNWGFGDVAVDENGIMHGSGLDAGIGNGPDFFKIDLNNRNLGFTIIRDGEYALFQLAFVDGKLIGHSTMLGDNYTVRLNDGNTEFLSTHGSGNYWLNDAATLPSPAAATLLGLAGMFASRRRR